jgi:hypothetical protein
MKAHKTTIDSGPLFVAEGFFEVKCLVIGEEEALNQVGIVPVRYHSQKREISKWRRRM